MKLYWKQGGQIFPELPMDPDWDSLMFIYKLGRFKIFTARRDGYLIGVNSFNVGPTLWRKTTSTAIGLILYLLPSERRGSLGWRFLRLTDEGLKEMGVKLAIYTPSADVDISRLLLRMRYKQKGGTFEKML
jgi:hypothetical protein